MRYLLDTNTCIGILTSRVPALIARWVKTPPSQVRLCSVVRGELLFGAAKGSKPEQTRQRLIGFFARFRSMPFDDVAAEEYATLRAALETGGTPIGPNDMMIAAIALAHELTLVTHNTDEFRRVAGLRIEDWER